MEQNLNPERGRIAPEQLQKKPAAHRMTAEEMDRMPGREMKEKRTRAGKVYDLGGGRYQAVLYPEPVHFRNKEGEWEEIDHTLNQHSAVLTDASRELSVGYAPGGRVTLQKDEFSLAWEIAGAADAAPQADHPSAHFPRHGEKRALESHVRYAGLFPGVDLDCRMQPHWFKDTLVFHSREALRPVEFLLHAPGLTFQQEADGAVIAAREGQMIFRLPAPLAMTAEGEMIPGSAHAKLAPIDADAWSWIVTVDADFAAHAEYPILLDPVVETEQTGTAMSMAYTSARRPTTAYPVTGYSTKVAINDSSLGKCDTYLRFKSDALPPIDSSYYVTGATLTLRNAYSCTSTNVYVKEVLSDWDASTLTYNNRPSVSSRPLDYYAVPPANGASSYFNITNMVRRWYDGQNYGLMLEALNGGLVQFGGAGAVYHKPYVTINYVSLAGLEGYLAQESHGCGRAGAAYVNLFNGNLVFAHQETRTNGNLMPVSIARYYNSCYYDEAPFGAGKGWKLSCQQTLHRETIGSVLHYVYMDGDGTRHHFKQLSGVWNDLSGLGLKLTLSASTATITDKGDNTLTFPLPTAEFNGNYDNVKMLQSVKDARGNTMTFTCNGRVLTAALDGAGRVTTGTVTGGMLTALAAPGTAAVVSAYADGNLTQITHEDGAVTTYAYDTDGMLWKVSNPDGTALMISYTGSAEPRRVLQITYLANNAAYAGRRYHYGDCRTTVTDLYPDAGGQLTEGKKLTYHFNDAGNVVSVNDELGYGCFTGYNANMPLNHPEYVSRMQRAVNNYLKNHRFLTVNTDWTMDPMTGTGSGAYTSDEMYSGGRSYKLEKTSPGGSIGIYQNVSLEKGKAYTLSCYFKTQTEAYAQLRVEWQNGAGATEYAESIARPATDAWDRLFVSFTLPGNAASSTVKARLLATGGTGTVWLDARAAGGRAGAQPL